MYASRWLAGQITVFLMVHLIHNTCEWDLFPSGLAARGLLISQLVDAMLSLEVQLPPRPRLGRQLHGGGGRRGGRGARSAGGRRACGVLDRSRPAMMPRRPRPRRCGRRRRHDAGKGRPD
jgi:hypothetical protein